MGKPGQNQVGVTKDDVAAVPWCSVFVGVIDRDNSFKLGKISPVDQFFVRISIF